MHRRVGSLARELGQDPVSANAASSRSLIGGSGASSRTRLLASAATVALLLPALAYGGEGLEITSSRLDGTAAQTELSAEPADDRSAEALGEPSGDLTALEQDLLRAERELASSALSSGRLQYDRGQYWEAVDSLKLAAKLSPDESEAFDLLGRALWQVGQSRIAEQCLRRALDLRRRDLGPDDPLVAAALSTLADFLVWQRRFEEAERAVSEALNVVSRGPGEESPEYVLALLTRAKLLAAQQEYRRALAEIGRALKIQRRISGNEHPVVADILNLKANLLLDQGIDHLRKGGYLQKLEFARTEAQRALKIARATRREDHPEIAYVLITLARLEPWTIAEYGSSGQGQRTTTNPTPNVENESEAPEGATAASGYTGASRSNRVHIHSAGVAAALGHISEAQQILHEELGAANPTMAETYVIRAELHLFLRAQSDQAEQWARRALALYPSFVGPEDPRLGYALKVLADVLDQTGPRDEAVAARRRASEILGTEGRPTLWEIGRRTGARR